jgi:hypothetical protein
LATSEVHVDPKRLREFAEQLNSTLAYYKKCLDVLDGKLSHLHATWRDQEFTAFAKELHKTKAVVEEFVREATEAHRRLLDDAERAESYQRIKQP